jgi:hypothetical protein
MEGLIGVRVRVARDLHAEHEGQDQQQHCGVAEPRRALPGGRLGRVGSSRLRFRHAARTIARTVV